MRSSYLMRNSLFPLFAHAQFQLDEKIFILAVCACPVTVDKKLFYSLSLRMCSSSLMRSFLLSQFAHAQFQFDEKLFTLSVCACAVSAWWEALYSLYMRRSSLMRTLYSLSLRMPSSSLMRSSLFPVHAKVKLDENSLFPQPAHAQFQLGERLFIP